MDKDLADKMLPMIQALRFYHRHEVVGMSHLPKEGPCIIVSNHSLATYDVVLLAAAIYAEKAIIVKPLIDQLFFRIPYLGEIMEFLGSTKGTPENALRLLDEKHILCVAPGGMQEALRPSSQKYQIKWERRKGFARISLKTGSPIILAACPKADDLYTVYSNPITKFAYENFRIPVFLAKGLGPTILPKPVKLVHHLSEPIYPPSPSLDPDEFSKQVDEYHASIVKKMKQIMKSK